MHFWHYIIILFFQRFVVYSVKYGKYDFGKVKNMNFHMGGRYIFFTGKLIKTYNLMSNKPIKAYILTKKPMFWPKWILKPENSIVGHYHGTVISIVQSMYDQKSPNLDQIAT